MLQPALVAQQLKLLFESSIILAFEPRSSRSLWVGVELVKLVTSLVGTSFSENRDILFRLI